MDLASSGGNSPSTSYSQIEDDKKQESPDKNIVVNESSSVAVDRFVDYVILCTSYRFTHEVTPRYYYKFYPRKTNN